MDGQVSNGTRQRALKPLSSNIPVPQGGLPPGLNAEKASIKGSRIPTQPNLSKGPRTKLAGTDSQPSKLSTTSRLPKLRLPAGDKENCSQPPARAFGRSVSSTQPRGVPGCQPSYLTRRSSTVPRPPAAASSKALPQKLIDSKPAAEPALSAPNRRTAALASRRGTASAINPGVSILATAATAKTHSRCNPSQPPSTSKQQLKVGSPSAKSPSPASKPQTLQQRRSSGFRGRQLGMDKLQLEYEALQQKLALLKRDSSRDNSRVGQSTPSTVGHVSRVEPFVPDSSTGVGAAPPSAGLAPGSAAPKPLLPHANSILSAGITAAGAGPDAQCSALDAAEVQQLRKFVEKYPGSSLAQQAAVFLGDEELVQAMEHGLTAQLQRTKDGATAHSRITELAGLVKSLRKSLRDLAGKASAFVDEGVKLEADFCQKSGGFSQESKLAMKRLEAEAAHARKAAAQTEATYKMERAEWITSLDNQKFEISRLTRDLEGLEEQRDRAREEGKRSEQQRIQLEAEIKELRKAASQQLRDAHMTQGEVEKALREEQQAAERREQELKADNQKLRSELTKATSELQLAQNQLADLQQTQSALQESLVGKQSAESQLLEKLTQVRASCESAQRELQAAIAEKQHLQQEVSAANDQLMLMQSELKLKSSRLEAATQQMAAADAEHRAEQAMLQSQLQELQTEKESLQKQATALQAEVQTANQQIGSLTASKGQLEVSLQQANQQHQLLLVEHKALQDRATSLQDTSAELQGQVAELQSDLEAVQDALANSRTAAAAQTARLAHLEGEFEALQEVMGEGDHRDVVAGLLSKISSLQGAAAAAEATRRELHNQMVELRGKIRVFCRVRPHPSSAVRCLPGNTSLALNVDGKEHTFGFDRVFSPSDSQANIFSEVAELVQSALDGYHVCLFSYGQTGAGKTFTMQGTPDEQGRGIIPRAVEQLLEAVERLGDQEWAYTLEASFIEVYNNQLRDLLAEGAGTRPDAGRISDSNAIKHDAAGGHTIVAGANRVPVRDAAGAAELVQRASEARACESTAMNAVSSRSHVVFMLYISGGHAVSGTNLTGCLCLVDLAGSERLDRSLAEDQRKKEACSINQSLSALGDVFAALSSKNGHIPYRNSKLTYLLQPCLGGSGKTLMFVNINPEPASAFESLCSLKFAAKVNGCETAAKGGAKRNVQGGGAALPALGGPGSSQGGTGLGKRAANGPASEAGPKRSKLGV